MLNTKEKQKRLPWVIKQTTPWFVCLLRPLARKHSKPYSYNRGAHMERPKFFSWQLLSHNAANALHWQLHIEHVQSGVWCTKFSRKTVLHL